VSLQARPILALAALLLSASLLYAARPVAAQAPAAPEAPAHVSIAGQLLIANPSMGDPNFAQTVILMFRHDKDGAFGIIINRPIATRPLAELLAVLGEKDATVTGEVRIFAGGPVQPELGFVVHSADYRGPLTVDAAGGMAVTSSREILRDIGNGKGPKKSLFAFGYAGWGPGQLDAEMTTGAWGVAPADERLVFDEDPTQKWIEATTRRLLDL
jgi:putative transcriptional regulator